MWEGNIHNGASEEALKLVGVVSLNSLFYWFNRFVDVQKPSQKLMEASFSQWSFAKLLEYDCHIVQRCCQEKTTMAVREPATCLVGNPIG